VVPSQLHCAPLPPFVCSSVIIQVSAGVPETPVTLACNVTWPLTGTAAVAGETVTVTLLKLVSLLPPQPVMTISTTIGATSSRVRRFVQSLQNERGWYTRPSANTRQKGRKGGLVAWRKTLTQNLLGLWFVIFSGVPLIAYEFILESKFQGALSAPSEL
jgi:hypothetical protein